MKHSWRYTGELLVWTAISVLIGLLVIPRAESVFGRDMTGVNTYVYVSVLLVVILVGAALWLLMMRKFRPERVDLVFAFGIAMVMTRVVSLLAPDKFYGELDWEMFYVRAICILVFYNLYVLLIRRMQRSWDEVQRLTWLNNAVMVVVLPCAAVIIALEMSPVAVMVLLGATAIYDAWAVWKSKTMVKMAKFFIGRRIIPGVAVPYPTEKKGFAMLGGGDIFFILLVATSFWTFAPFAALIVASTMYASLVVLFLLSEKKKFYPALPFLFAGALVGLAIVKLGGG